MARKPPPSKLRKAPEPEPSSGQSVRRWSIIIFMAALLPALVAFGIRHLSPPKPEPRPSPSEVQAEATGAPDTPERLTVKVLSAVANVPQSAGSGNPYCIAPAFTSVAPTRMPK